MVFRWRWSISVVMWMILCAAAAAGSAGTGEMVPMEWNAEQARQAWSPMVRPVQHVGVPGYQFQTGIMWNGALVFGPLEFLGLKVMQDERAPLGDNLLHVSVGFGDTMRIIDRKGTNDTRIRRRLEEGRLPIPRIETRDGDLSWRQTTFAHLLGKPMEKGMDPAGDEVMVTHARFTVTNRGFASQTGHLWLHFGDTTGVKFGYKAVQRTNIAPSVAHSFDAPYGRMDGRVRYVIQLPARGSVRFHEEIPAPEGTETAPQRVLEWEVPLEPGEEAELTLIVPYGLVDQNVAGELAALDSEKVLNDVRSYWRGLLYGIGEITTPDPFVNDYLVAVAGQMAQQVACRYNTGVWMYKTSPNHYEGYWPCNAAKALPAFDLRGLHDINRPVLASFVDQQTDDVRGMEKGAMGHDQNLAGEGYARIDGFLGSFGEWTANPLLLSHGLGMWALASHYRITRDRDWLGEGNGSPLQAMIDAFDWVTKQRERTMREENGQKVAHWGLLPAASAHDWLAGNTIFNDAFCIYGMAEVIRVLREIGHPRVDEMMSELAAYRKCLKDRYAEARDRARPLPLSDGSTIPFVPRMVQELDWAKPDWTYTGYGPIRAGAWGALDPHDDLVNQSLAYLEAGMPAGEGSAFAESVTKADTADANFAHVSDPQGERHWLWRHYVEYETMWPIGGPLFLARDDLPRFFEWLFNNLAFVLHQDFRVGVESIDGVPSCAPGEGERWQQIRRMFVNEFGGYDGSQQSLWLLQAIPRSWLRPGYRMSVKRMPTWFGGTVDLEAVVAADGNSVELAAQLNDLAEQPEEIIVRLRSGDGRPLAAAEINGSSVAVLDKDTIRIPAAKNGKFAVVGRFQAGRRHGPPATALSPWDGERRG